MNIWNIRRRRKRELIGRNSEVIIVEKFPNLMTDIIIEIQKAETTPDAIIMNRSAPVHSSLTLRKTRGKEKIRRC